MTTKEEILYFISHFQNPGTIETFTHGCCYWFANILDNRFNSFGYESGIWYNSVDNHFATMIFTNEGPKLFDITGELQITDEWESWWDFTFKDSLLTERIINDCIDKIKEDK